MKFSTSIPVKLAMFAATMLSSGVALSQSSIVEFSGQMHATATTCGDYSQSQLQEMKKKQKEQYMGLGMSATKFESEFQQGYQKEKARLDKSSAVARAKECEKFKAMAKM